MSGGAPSGGRPEVVATVPRGRHLVVEASAGTGKTFLLEHLYVDLLVGGARFEEVLVVTFTEKAAREMKERIRARLGEALRGGEAGGWRLDEAGAGRLREALAGLDRAPISTIHAFCLGVLREHPREAGLPVGLRQAEGASMRRTVVVETLRRALAEAGPLEPAQRQTLLDWVAEAGFEHVAALLGSWLAAGEEGLAVDLPSPWRERDALRRTLLPLMRERLRALRALGLVDFDAMIELVARALDDPGSPLRARLQARFRHALVDEFQDTSEAQWRIFEALFLERERAGEATLAIIGDPKQAIYGFRGGDLLTYLRARRRMLGDGVRAHRHALETTYRCGEPMVRLFAWLFGEGAGEDGPPDFFRMDEVGYAPLRSGRPARRAGSAKDRPLPPLRLLVCCPEGEEAVRKEDVERAVLAEVAATLADWFAGDGSGAPRLLGDEEEGGPPRPLRPRDVFVLCRTRREAEAATEALRRAGVPAVLYKQRGLYEGPEAEALRALLQALLEPEHPGRRLAAWLTPYFALGPEELGAAAGLGEREEAEEGEPLRRLRRWARLAREGDWPTLLREAEEALTPRQLALAPSERYLANARALHELLLQWAARGLGPAEMLARLQALGRGERPEEEGEGLERLPSERDAVQVMTAHVSKGLEAEVVFVLGAPAPPQVEALRPLPVALGGGTGEQPPRRALAPCPVEPERKRTSPPWSGPEPEPLSPTGPLPPQLVLRAAGSEQQREARRLGYVAATRARRLLVLPYFPPSDEAAERALGREGCTGLCRRTRSGPGKPVMAHGSFLLDRFEELLALDAFQALRGELWEARRCAVRRAPEAGHDEAALDVEVRAERLAALLCEAGGEEPSPRTTAPSALAEAFERAAPARPTSFTAAQRAAERTAVAPPPVVAAGEADEEGDGEEAQEEARAWLDPLEEAEPLESEGGETGEAPAGGEALPGGRLTGILLHEALEAMDLQAVAEQSDFEAWWEARGAALLEGIGRRLGAEEALWRPAGKLLHAALRCPVRLPGGVALGGGLASLHRARRRAEHGFRLWLPAAGGPPRLVEGSVDLLFEHEGRIYLLDWKSNRLPEATDEAVGALVREHYALQVALYTLGVAAGLGWIDPEGRPDAEALAARFGGVLYAFLRGLAEGHPEACWTLRPEPGTLEAWWSRLRSEPVARWGRAVAARFPERGEEHP